MNTKTITANPVSLSACLLLAACGLSACQAQQATTSSPAGQETVSIRTTPCFGTCPVFAVTLHPDGQLDFEGIKFVKHSGKVTRHITADKVKAIRQTLQAYRPAAGVTTRNKDCQQRVTDHPSYVVTWQSPKAQDSVYRHYTGCFSAANRAIAKTLRGVLTSLPIADLAAPTKVKRLPKK